MNDDISIFTVFVDKISSNPFAITLYFLSLAQAFALLALPDYDVLKVLSLFLNDIISNAEVKARFGPFIRILQEWILWELGRRRTVIIVVLFHLHLLFKFSLSNLFFSIMFSLIFIFASKIQLLFVLFYAHIWLAYILLPDSFSKTNLLLIFGCVVYVSYIAYSDKSEELFMIDLSGLTKIVRVNG